MICDCPVLHCLHTSFLSRKGVEFHRAIVHGILNGWVKESCQPLPWDEDAVRKDEESSESIVKEEEERL